MSKEQFGHAELASFAEERVKLPKDKADEFRDQAQRLQEKLERYLDEHPEFTLKRMLLSGSLPETLVGFVFVIAIAIVGIVIAREGCKLERFLAN